MNKQEEVFCGHLTSVDSLDVIAAEGFSNPISLAVLPTELVRDITLWCLEYYFKNGRKVAPSKEAIEGFWADEMEAVGVEILDDIETDSVEWAIEKLRAEYARWRAEELIKKISQEVAQARDADRVDAVMDSAHEFYLLGQALISRRQESLAGDGLLESIRRHNEIAENGDAVSGMTFGMPMLDDHMLGVHPGELCIVAAFSGVGKSWMTLKPLIAEWKRGRRCVLFTLENDLDMTFDRMACVLAKVPYQDWQRGECDDAQVERVMKHASKIKESKHQPIVIMPQHGELDPVSLVRKARLLGADSMIIDQLSHVDPVPGSKLAKRNEIFAHTTHVLSKSIKGREALPCLLMHQIKREGNDRARRTGRLVMDDMADTSQVEREATTVLAIYQSEVMKAAGQAQLQELKLRRGDTKTWEMSFRVAVGDIRVMREVEPEE